MRGELKRLVDNDSVVRELYHMRGEVVAGDWDRLGKGLYRVDSLLEMRMREMRKSNEVEECQEE